MVSPQHSASAADVSVVCGFVGIRFAYRVSVALHVCCPECQNVHAISGPETNQITESEKEWSDNTQTNSVLTPIVMMMMVLVIVLTGEQRYVVVS